MDEKQCVTCGKPIYELEHYMSFSSHEYGNKHSKTPEVHICTRCVKQIVRSYEINENVHMNYPLITS